jgi:hypothetical protein
MNASKSLYTPKRLWYYEEKEGYPMKRLLVIVLVLCTAFVLFYCSKTHVSSDAKVTLIFAVHGEDIRVVLTDDEAAKVIDIIDGKRYDPIASGVPACGFGKDVAFKVGLRTFAIAQDKCSCMQDLGNLRFFNISDEDIQYIHALFEKYGGYFPCI